MGLFDRGGGTDTGNIFLRNDPNHGDNGDYSKGLAQSLQQKGEDLMYGSSYNDGVGAIQNNPVQSMLFGPNGQMQQTNQQVTNLENRGYSLQPEDYEAYGQASGNIARMFGQNSQSLSQSLADRGLSNSGIAAQQFSGLNGNTNEQLAGLQTNIAQQRMQMNTQRLGQMQSFLGTLGNQAQQGINSANDLNMQKGQSLYSMGRQDQGDIQNQNNIAMSQRMASSNPGNLSQFMGAFNSASQVGTTIGEAMAGVPPGMGQAPSSSNTGALKAGGSGMFSGSNSPGNPMMS